MSIGRIVFADQTEIIGESAGASGSVTGMMMTYTSMTDYQSILCDPACHDQIVCLTYPLIGNVGTVNIPGNQENIQAAGIIFRESADEIDHWLGKKNLSEWFKEQGKIALSGIDTREIIRHLRQKGPMNAIITTDSKADRKELALEAAAWRPDQLSTAKVIRECPARGKAKYHIAVLDLGIRRSMIESLTSRGCELTLIPPDRFGEISGTGTADALVISSGSEQAAIAAGSEVLDGISLYKSKLPILAVDAGFLLLARSYGLTPEMMHFGHSGANYPVHDLQDKRTRMTLQHHHYTISREQAEAAAICEITHININDDTVEGLSYGPDISSVQFLPDNDDLPHQTGYVWEQLLKKLDKVTG